MFIPRWGMLGASQYPMGVYTCSDGTEQGVQMAEATRTIELTAPDISCAHCVATVEGALSGLTGVSEVKASSDTKIVRITIDPSGVSEAHIREVLDEAGYPVS